MPWGIVGSLAGGALGFLGQSSANKSQKFAAHVANVNAVNMAENIQRRDERWRKEDLYLSSPEGIRAEAEKAGFNPLTLLASGRSLAVGNQSNASVPSLHVPQMGNEYAQLGQGIADAFNGYEQLQIQRAELDMQRQRLEQLQKAVTLGEDVPGIYGARNAGTNKNSPVGMAGRGAGNRNDGSPSDTIGSTSHVAPDRPIEVSPYMSGAGLTEISNAGTDLIGGPIVVPGDDGEPWGFDEVLTATVAGIPQIGMRVGEAMTLGDPSRPMISAAEAKKFRDKQKREREERKKAKEKPKRIGPYPDLRSKTARRKYMRREAPYVR